MKELRFRYAWIFVAGCFLSFTAAGQSMKTDKKLQSALQALADSFHGRAGIYVYHLKKSRVAAVNADTLFPTASIVKIPIMVGLFDRLEKDSLSYNRELTYRDSLKYGGSGLMQYFKDSSKTTVAVLAALMIGYSDNTTSLWNQSLAGGGEAINRVMAQNGFQQTRVNSRTPGREKIRELYGWGQTTPREMAQLLVRIRQGTIVSAAACEKMYRLMTHVYYDEYALSEIPPFVQVASKQGMVDDSRSELVMVNAPHGDYVFYIATKNNRDTSWKHNNEAWQLARKVSAVIWHYYEPDYNWTPASGRDRFFEN